MFALDIIVRCTLFRIIHSIHFMGFVHHFSYPSVQKYDKNLRIYLGSWSEGEICHGEEDTEPGTAWFMMAEMCS